MDKHSLMLVVAEYFNIIMAVLVLVIFIGGYFYLIGPKYRETKREIGTLAQARQAEYNELSHYNAKIKGYLDDYRRVKEENREKIEKMLPAAENREDLYPLLEMIVLKNGAIPAKIGLEWQEGETGAKEKTKTADKEAEDSVPPSVGMIRITLDVRELDYRGLKRLLSSLESSLRLMDIVRIEFAPKEKKAELEIDTYFYKG